MSTVLRIGLAFVISAVTATTAGAYPFQRYVLDASERYGIEEPLIRAIIISESNYNQYALSHKGALGLMQLLITTAREYEPWVSRFQLQEEPDVNIDIGVRHLKDLDRQVRKRYPRVTGLGRIKLIAAAYNAGWGRVVRAGGQVPPILETRGYVRRVSRYYQRYGGKLKSAPKPVPKPVKQVERPASEQKPAQPASLVKPVARPAPTNPTPAAIPEVTPFDFTQETARLFAICSMLFLGYVFMAWSQLSWITGKGEG